MTNRREMVAYLYSRGVGLDELADSTDAEISAIYKSAIRTFPGGGILTQPRAATGGKQDRVLVHQPGFRKEG